MKRKTIILNSEDLPTLKSIVDTVSRLKKDFNLLSKFRGSKDTEDPVSFKSVISFLEMLVKREKRNFPKDKRFVDDHMDAIVDLAANHLNEMDGWEIARNIEETQLKEVVEKYMLFKEKGPQDD